MQGWGSRQTRGGLAGCSEQALPLPSLGPVGLQSPPVTGHIHPQSPRTMAAAPWTAGPRK